MADQQEPTTPAELAKDVASLAIDADNKAELTTAAATTVQDEAVKDPVTRMQEWRDEILAKQEWKDLQGPALHEWAARQAKALTSITKSMLKTRQPRQLRDLTIKRPEPVKHDPELEARKKQRMAELREIWNREDFCKPERSENQEEFKWDTNSIEYKKIMDAKREHLRKSEEERLKESR
ncbi:hypothetical protein TKK_0019516 [Trichogramma kaykai]